MGRAFHRQRVGVFVVVVCFASLLKNAWRTRAHTAHTISNRERVGRYHNSRYIQTNQPTKHLICRYSNTLQTFIGVQPIFVGLYICPHDALDTCYALMNGMITCWVICVLNIKYYMYICYFNGIGSIVNIFPTVHYM
jgi:hypothetical protein